MGKQGVPLVVCGVGTSKVFMFQSANVNLHGVRELYRYGYNGGSCDEEILLDSSDRPGTVPCSFQEVRFRDVLMEDKVGEVAISPGRWTESGIDLG